jgi:hypothetical protein
MNLSLRFVYPNEIMEKFNQKHGYNYFEINMKLSELHPYLPPIVSYIKPKVDIKLIKNILGLDIWKASSWNYLISLESIVINLSKALEEHFMKYIDIEDGPFDFIELKLLELVNNHTNDMIELNFNKIDISSKTQLNNGFKPGTGYGNGKENKWDITKYIKEQEYEIQKITESLNNINKLINKHESLSFYWRLV